MNTSRHLENRDEADVPHNMCIGKGGRDDNNNFEGIESWGMPVISALWLVETEPLYECGSCGGERYQVCNSPFFCQK